MAAAQPTPLDSKADNDAPLRRCALVSSQIVLFALALEGGQNPTFLDGLRPDAFVLPAVLHATLFYLTPLALFLGALVATIHKWPLVLAIHALLMLAFAPLCVGALFGLFP